MNRQGCLATRSLAIVLTVLAGWATANDKASPSLPDSLGTVPWGVRSVSVPTDPFAEIPALDLSRPQPLPPIEAMSSDPAEEAAPPDIRKLMRPTFDFGVEWEPETSGLAIGAYDARVTVPAFPVFGPPPMITAGFSFTELLAPESYDLPSSLYDVSLGISGIRKLNDRWMIRWMIGSSFASDWENTTSDAWRFHGGCFALWKCHEQWQITLGALATGREDIPVLPAAGAIWQPTPRVRVDLMMPRPRVNFMIADRGDRQQWIYAGGGLDGGTWAYQRASGTDELLTYREWRLVLGWESKPPGRVGGPPAPGWSLGMEVGYVLGRTFEFDSGAPELEPDDSLLVRATMKF